MSLTQRLVFILSASLVGACTADTATPSTDSKAEARSNAGKFDEGIDYCEINDWYGDGECDEFCTYEDSDCVAPEGCITTDDCPAIVCPPDPFGLEFEACPVNVCVAGECVVDDVPFDVCGPGEQECASCGIAVCFADDAACPADPCGEEPMSPTEPTCGGEVCADNEFCNYTLDAQCGNVSDEGSCEPRGGLCVGSSSPVCGCDGATYSNESCANARGGVAIARYGSCE